MKEALRKSVLAVGPFHPLQEEMEFFQLTVDGEKVTDVQVRLSRDPGRRLGRQFQL